MSDFPNIDSVLKKIEFLKLGLVAILSCVHETLCYSQNEETLCYEG